MRKNYILLTSIMALGFFLRIYGINFGLPNLYHADEPIIVNHAMAYGLGDFNPHFFKIPPLVSYLLFFIYGIYFILGKMAGIFDSANNFAIAFLNNPTSLYLIGRIFIGAILGTATIWAVYILGKKLFSKKTGILSTLFLSVVFLHVQNSHYIYVDIPMVLFIVLTCISTYNITKNNNLKNYILSGIFAGVATAIKYNAILIFIIIIMTFLINKNKKDLLKVLISFIVLVATFIICNPFSILDFSFFIKNVFKQAGAEGPVGILYHLKYSLAEGLGFLLLFLGIIGMIAKIVKGNKIHLIFLSFPILFYLVLCFFSQHHERYGLPLVPFFATYAAGLLDEKLKNNVAISTLAVLIIIPNFGKALYSDYLFTKEDSRTLAKHWIETNISAGSKIALEHSFFCPRLSQTRLQIEDKIEYLDQGEIAKRKRLELELKLADNRRPAYNLFYLKDLSEPESSFLFEKPNIKFSLADLKDNNIEYVIIHIDSRRNVKQDFYQGLLKSATLIKEFSPYKDKNKQYAEDLIVQTAGPFLSKELFSRNRNGYIIKIFKLKVI